MKKSYEVLVTMTGKAVGDKSPKGEGYSVFNEDTHNFLTITEAKTWLKEQYSQCKREKMYAGESQHVGYIYCFKNSDISHDSEAWYQQDWVTVHEKITKPVIITA